jgi:hypothetical protein
MTEFVGRVTHGRCDSFHIPCDEANVGQKCRYNFPILIITITNICRDYR